MSAGRPFLEARQQAIAAGDIKYIGSPCKRCGNILRYTQNGACVDCACNATNKWRQARREMAT